MAVTLTDQRTIISEADATTGWTGSNTVTLFTADPSGIESTGCLGMVVSNTTQNAYFTVSSVDLSAGVLIYAWIFHRAELDTRTNGGLMIQLGDGTNRVGYHIAGSDVDSFRHSEGPVGWQCLLLDTANLPASTTTFAGVAGNLTLTAITQIGIAFKTLVKATGGVSNCFWDIHRRGAVGEGLRITGGTGGDPGTFEQITVEDRNTGNQRAHGVVRKLGTGLYGCQGPLWFGDNAGTGAHVFSDSNGTMVFEDRTVTTTKYSINVQGNATGAGTFSLTNFILSCPSTRSAAFDASDAEMDIVTLTTVQLVGFRAGVTFSNDATNGPNHLISDCVFRNCAQVAVNRVPVSDTTFTTTTATTSALLWNANIDIINCQFLTNTTGAGIEHNAAGTFTYDNLTFSGNTFDIRNSVNATTADSYSDTNQSATTAINDTNKGIGQSITGNGGVLSNIRWHLSKTGTPTGNATAKLYAHSGVFGTSSLPTGAALATSDPVNVANLTGTLTLTQFQFTDEVTLTAATNYVITLEYADGTGANFISAGTDTSAPSHGGNFATYNGTSWTAVSGTDGIFFCSTGGIVTINATNGANPGTYTNVGSPPGATIINVSVPLEITGLTEGSRGVMIGSGGAENGNILLQGYADGDGIISGTFGGITPQDVIIRARNGGIINAAIQDDGGVFADYTNAARTTTGAPGTGSTDDVNLTPATAVANDAFYFGGLAQFGQIDINITTVGSGYSGTWEYFNGSWSSLTVVDDTSSFTVSGHNTITFTKPSDWSTTTINGQGPFYYVRFRITSVTTPVQPQADSISLKRTSKYEHFDSTGTIQSGTGLTTNAVWVIDTNNSN